MKPLLLSFACGPHLKLVVSILTRAEARVQR